MPIVVSSHNPDVIHHASQFVFRSNDGGNTWAEISPDLTRNDKSKQVDSGGPITMESVFRVEYFDRGVLAGRITQARQRPVGRHR